MKNWHGLIKILEIQHVRQGKIIWEAKDLYNLLHTEAEEFFLNCLFASEEVPADYYLGLDDREELAAADTMDDILDEPTTNGYLRQTVNTTNGWTVTLHNGVYRALSQIVSFTAAGGSWGPVKNLFMTTASDDSGVLISSVPLSSEASLTDGDAINMRMALSLRDCPSS